MANLPIYIFQGKEITEALRCELVARGFDDIPPADKCAIELQPAKKGYPLTIHLIEKV